MEKFFKPVHNPSAPDETKPRKHHHHRLPHHQDPQSHRYTIPDETDKNTDENHRHQRHHQRGHYVHDIPQHSSHHRHQTQQFPPSEENEFLYNHLTNVTLSAASSSSLSSSSSSFSSSSWYTEASANDPFSARHAGRPQHSLSCSNIPDVRRCREDDSTEPIVFASVKHGKKHSVCSETHGRIHQKGKRVISSLDRGHSRSEEGLLQGIESDLGGEQSREPNKSYGPLYKTASLNRGLAFSEEDILIGVSRGPKRAVSSSQLPSKGILKNKMPQNDIRKAKSMEVLSPRVSKEQVQSGQKGKGATQADIQQAQQNFVQGKLQFSAFLDEITKQVLSPSALTVLGMKNDKTTEKTPAKVPQTPGPVKPQLPPKKHRDSSGKEREQRPKQPNRQEKTARSSTRKHSDCSNPDKLISYATRNPHGSPSSHHYYNSSSPATHYGSSHVDRRPSSSGGSVPGDRYSRCGSHLTDGTSTSPELSQPKQRHHRKQQPTVSHSTHSQHSQHPPQQVQPGSGHRGLTSSPLCTAQGAGPGLGSESSSSKSDSPRTRDTASTATSHSSEQSGQHHSRHSGYSRRDTVRDADQLHALQEENADLHQNLLQTVVCIESLEVELQRTRDELSHVKEKYKSLLETHTGTKQANNLLGEHLHIASESLSSERKYLLNHVSQLTSELEDAHRTIAALENINVPCLIKELLEKHFDSDEAIQKFLSTSAPTSCSTTSSQADSQSHAPKVGKETHDWLRKPEASLQRVTAFVPFKQGVLTTGTEASISMQQEPSYSPPFSVADISTAICNKMAASYADRPQILYCQNQQQPPLGANHTDTPPKLQQVNLCGDSWGGKGGVKVTLLEQDVVGVTSVSAQQILDDFMQQLQANKKVGGGKEQQGGQEWVGAAEQTGKVAE